MNLNSSKRTQKDVPKKQNLKVCRNSKRGTMSAIIIISEEFNNDCYNNKVDDVRDDCNARV